MGYLSYPAWLARLFQRLELERTRMARLLRRRGVDPAAYARAYRLVEVEAQIARCYGCACRDICERAVKARGRSRSRYSFCPNTPQIDRFLATRGG